MLLLRPLESPLHPPPLPTPAPLPSAPPNPPPTHPRRPLQIPIPLLYDTPLLLLLPLHLPLPLQPLLCHETHYQPCLLPQLPHLVPHRPRSRSGGHHVPAFVTDDPFVDHGGVRGALDAVAVVAHKDVDYGADALAVAVEEEGEWGLAGVVLECEGVGLLVGDVGYVVPFEVVLLLGRWGWDWGLDGD